MGAGLGGGSSNAAAALIAADQIWNTKASMADLQSIALMLGSDVPFFLVGGTALGEGRGEILTPLPLLSKYWILLVCPDIHVDTSWAYSQAKITLTKDEKLTKFRSIFHRYEFHTLKEKLVNEFEGVVFSRHPVLQGIKDQMYERDAFYASMSGSGSTIYGFFQNRRIAERANTFFFKQGLRTFICRPIKSVLSD
jgi:4-diphosphocytidyl-2-C-methyl-D-erythritol kinase